MGTSLSEVDPKAIDVMQEIGIDISAQTFKSIDKDILEQADFLIKLCGDARESCPVVTDKVQKRHWPLEDPAGAGGAEEKNKDILKEG